jgi:hypothetical protein
VPDTTDSRLELLKTSLQGVVDAAGSHRVVTRDFAPLENRDHDELLRGVWSLVVVEEDEFIVLTGGQSDEGAINVLAIGHLMVRDDQKGSDVEAAELAMVGEIKDLVNSALPADICGLRLLKWRGSGQLAAPFGWVTATLRIL